MALPHNFMLLTLLALCIPNTTATPLTKATGYCHTSWWPAACAPISENRCIGQEFPPGGYATLEACLGLPGSSQSPSPPPAPTTTSQTGYCHTSWWPAACAPISENRCIGQEFPPGGYPSLQACLGLSQSPSPPPAPTPTTTSQTGYCHTSWWPAACASISENRCIGQEFPPGGYPSVAACLGVAESLDSSSSPSPSPTTVPQTNMATGYCHSSWWPVKCELIAWGNCIGHEYPVGGYNTEQDCLMLRNVPSMSTIHKRDACVIGAGPGGLSAARFLQERGLNVAVFEQKDRVGGRVYSPQYNGVRQDIGATVVGMSKYNISRTLAEHFGLSLAPFLGLRFADLTLGFVAPRTTGVSQEFIDAVGKYALLLSQPPFDAALAVEGTGFLNLEDPTFHKSALQWLLENQLDALIPSVAMWITTFGYGALDAVSTLTMAKIITLGNFDALLEPEFMQGGMQQLMEGIASELNEPVHLNAQVAVGCNPSNAGLSSCRRSRLSLNGGQMLFDCSNVFVAFPPVAERLQRLFVDGLDANELNVFSAVELEPYSSALVDWPNFPFGTADAPTSVVVGLLDCATGECNFAPPGVANSLYPSLSLITTQTDNKAIVAMGYNTKTSTNPEAEFADLVGNFGAASGNGDLKLVEGSFNAWDYMPHFAEENSHLYAALEARQGVRGVFYVGGLMNGDSVETTMAHTKELVARFFS